MVLTNPNHVFSSLLPDETDQWYYLRESVTTDNLFDEKTDSSVIILQYICCLRTVIDLCISCILKTFNKEDHDDDGATLIYAVVVLMVVVV